ncbi:MAG TPA: cation:proton antiporter [Spirochaetota bacterium]|nr:cation:proton antiporter [Spirochaetota bacterium]HOR45334.1 cation:proton antiporter [Spirochaetota bacterium]HPK57044.1 cation:proton antiporter [Spirochaetota bacterium]
MHYLNESNILLFLIQLALILFLARITGEIFRRFKQPVLTAELIIGVILGPTLFGRFYPEIFTLIFPNDAAQQNMLETISWIGVLFLLMDTGLEIDFSSAWRQRGSALVIALSDIIIPMLIAFIPCFLLPDQYLADPDKRLYFALFMAVVMTISAMPIASRVMHDLLLLKTDIGFLTMSALAVNDIIGWVLFTIILGLFTQSGLNSSFVVIIFFATIGFSVLALTVGRKFSNIAVDYFQKKNVPEPAASFSYVCILGVIFGALTQKLGIHALFGFFIAGIVAGEAKNLKDDTRAIISQMVHSLFVPVFFVNIGLKIDFFANFELLPVILITAVGIFGRFIGAWVGVTFSKVPKINRTLISIAHTPGGMMEIVVALLALEAGIITPKIFIAIVCSAVISSIIMGPWMTYAMKKRKDVSLSSYINYDYGIMMLEEKNRNDTIKKMLQTSKSFIKNIDLNNVEKVLIIREEEYSTAIGDGIAIPHARLESISDPVLLTGISDKGIEWNAPDGKPVNMVFLLLSPAASNDLHIEIISKLSRLMQKSFNRNLLLNSTNVKILSERIKQLF